MLEKQYYTSEDCIRVDKSIKSLQEEITKPNPSNIYQLISFKNFTNSFILKFSGQKY